MVSTMLPPPEALPDVLPSERLLRSGKPVPEVRTELRRIAAWRNALTVAGLWCGIVGLIWATVWIGHPLAYAVTYLLMGSVFARLAILGHEAAHRLLFPTKRWNDLIGRWVLSYPGFVPFEAYRRVHFAHHRDEFGPDEPDLALYAGYPITRASWRRKLTRDASGQSGWKSLKPLLKALASKSARPFASRIVGAQLVVWALSWALTDRWWIYPLLWLGPWMTVWRVINRLRAIAEHGGMVRSDDRRLTTHHVRQTWLARFWMVPYNTGWHLAHHVDMGVPWRNLPRLHAELVAAGWVTRALEHPSYRAFWRACSSRPERPATTPATPAPVAS